MMGFGQDLAYGFRILCKHPGFTAAAVISLALGIGANAAVYSLANALLLRPFPFRDPERLVSIYTSREGMKYGRSSYPDYQDVRNRCDAFSGVLARLYWPVSVKQGSKPKVVLANLVSENYFDVLGVNLPAGRAFLAEEGAVGTPHAVVVLSDNLWKRGFGSEPNMVGSTIYINSYPFTIIGIGPKAFRGEMVGFATDLWMPIAMASRILPVGISLQDRGGGWLDMVGRLREDVPEKQAQAALETLASNLRQEYATSNKDKSFAIVSGAGARFPVAELGRGVTGFIAVLMGVVCLTLLIACSNVANLLLARGTGRKREIAMRLALGAGRGRILRQLLTESLLLSLLAGMAGLLIAIWVIDLFALVDAPTPIPLALDVSLDYRVLSYTLLLSLFTGVLFGLIPALQMSKLDLRAATNEQGNSGMESRSKARLQTCLVTGQIALSLVLFTAAGLCLKSLRAALSADPGFEVRNGLAVGLNLSYGGYDEPRGRVFYQRLLERVQHIPSVRSASLALILPLSYMMNMEKVVIEGHEPRRGENLLVQNNAVGAHYFETLGIPIVAGRGFDEQDRQDTERVAIVNETMARRFWRAANPIGKGFSIDGMKLRIVGIARDGRYFQLGEKQEPFFYRPLSQAYSAFTTLHVRTAGDPRLLIQPMRDELEKLDPNLPISDVKTLAEHMRLSQYPARIVGLTVSCFGLLALALAIVGVYGMMSYSARRRMREFGIRIALGAPPAEIKKLVMRQGAMILLAGSAIGLAVAFAVTRLLSSLLYGVSALDPVIFAGVSLILAAVVLLACYLPARRAATCDPVVALRCE
jgi:predicted permease